MAEDVNVTFGAQIDQFESGVDKAKNKLDEFGSKTEQVGDFVKGLGMGMLEAFSVAAIGALVEKMAELGTATERTMAMLGVGASQVGALSLIAKETGGDLE